MRFRTRYLLTLVSPMLMRGPFLEHHLKSLVSVDVFTVPTIRSQVLYAFLVLAHERRRILHFAVTAEYALRAFVRQGRRAALIAAIGFTRTNSSPQVSERDSRRDVHIQRLRSGLMCSR